MNRLAQAPFVLGLAMLAIGIVVSHWFGQDINWDLKNYHYYDGWALVSGAIDRDLWPAQQQSFANPVLPALAYLLIADLPPWAAAAVLAALQGVNFVLLAVIAGQIFPRRLVGDAATARLVLSLAAILIGATGSMMLAELGTTFGDNIVSIFVVGGLAALGRHRREGRLGWVALAGIAAGSAAGLKMTNIVYLVGLVVCGWWLGGDWRRVAARLLLFGAGAAVGIALTYGPWGWHLWRTRANPLFPYFNGLFRSPWRPFDSLRDERFLPHSLLDALSYPFQWALGYFPTSEVYFRDARFALAWLLLAVWLCATVKGRRGTASDLVDRGWLRVVVLF